MRLAIVLSSALTLNVVCWMILRRFRGVYPKLVYAAYGAIVATAAALVPVLAGAREMPNPLGLLAFAAATALGFVVINASGSRARTQV